MIVGIDEVGRGAWAGPLVVGAVLLGDVKIEGLTDSKKLTKKQRERLDIEIRQCAKAIGLGWVSAKRIDQIGLSEALKLASRRALAHIRHEYTEIIIDGTIRLIDDPRVTLMKKADLLIPSVSAASIIAKVARDNYMKHCDQIFPGYKFTGHVGYGTAVHRAAIEELGVTPLHRLSFAPLSKYHEPAVPASPGSKQTSPRRNKPQSASLPAAELANAQTSSPGQEVAFGLFGRLGSVFSPGKADATTGAMARSSRSSTKSSETSAARVSSDAGTRVDSRREAVSEDFGGEEANKVKTTKQIGNAGEDAAARYLWQLGHNIIDRNWRTKFCEIDIISRAGDTIYFTEVKYRKNDKQGGGLAAITAKKQRQMAFAAELYALKQDLSGFDLRLAVIDVSGDPPIVGELLLLG